MLTWQEINQLYICRFCNLIQKTTRPLKDRFGISYFTYHSIDNEGKYTVLVDRPDFAEHYVSEEIYLTDPYLRHPSVYHSGMTLMTTHGSKEYHEKISNSGKKVLDMDLGVLLIEKHTDTVEFFGFSGNKSSSLQNLYMNSPQLLHTFASYFKKELSSILSKMKQEAVSLIQLKGADFFLNEPVHPGLSSSDRLSYYEDLGLLRPSKLATKLSPRERELLKLLLKNYSAKETAAFLSLSKRTVEFYFENLKDKLSCYSKQELFQMAKLFSDVGLI